MGEVIRARKPMRLPVVMARDGVKAVLANLTGDKWLMTSLMYCAGLRLKECLRLRGQDINGSGEVFLDEAVLADQIGEYVRHLPISARSLGVHMLNGQPDPADLSRLAQERVMVRIRLA